MQRLILFLLSCCVTASVKHSLRHLRTATSGTPNVPDFVVVVLVDGYQTEYYDSNIRKAVPTQTWMNRVSEDDPDYWERQTAFWRGQEQRARANIEFYKERFNQSGGIHVLQKVYGCEWDDETGEVNGFDVVSYDREEVVMFDKNAKVCIPMKPEAETRYRRDDDRVGFTYLHHRLMTECPERLKKTLDYGKRVLRRTELPSVYLLQKTPSSPVSCLATGFYPHRAAIFWRKDGEKIHEQVDHGELLNNHDGSFQMSVDLNMSQIRADDWRRYHCVFQLSGVEEDMVTELDPALIKTNWVEESSSHHNTVAAVITVFIILTVFIGVTVYIGVTVFITVTVYRRRKDQDPSPSPEDVQLSQILEPGS